MMRHYILQDKKIVPVDLMTWAKWFETADRTVGSSIINGAKISTVFLGIDHSFDGGPPILWETMIFGGDHNQYQDRCSGNWEQAEAMHMKAVGMVIASDMEKMKDEAN